MFLSAFSQSDVRFKGVSLHQRFSQCAFKGRVGGGVGWGGGTVDLGEVRPGVQLIFLLYSQNLLNQSVNDQFWQKPMF